jgi:hypothetical protein
MGGHPCWTRTGDPRHGWRSGMSSTATVPARWMAAGRSAGQRRLGDQPTRTAQQQGRRGITLLRTGLDHRHDRQLLGRFAGQAAPRRTAVLRRLRVERRANGEASSVMTRTCELVLGQRQCAEVMCKRRLDGVEVDDVGNDWLDAAIPCSNRWPPARPPASFSTCSTSSHRTRRRSLCFPCSALLLRCGIPAQAGQAERESFTCPRPPVDRWVASTAHDRAASGAAHGRACAYFGRVPRRSSHQQLTLTRVAVSSALRRGPHREPRRPPARVTASLATASRDWPGNAGRSSRRASKQGGPGPAGTAQSRSRRAAR